MSETLRLRASSRAAGALVGAIVTAIGLACIAVYSGRDLDLELLGIVILGGAGVWLLLSALAAGVSGARRSRSTSTAAPKATSKEKSTSEERATSESNDDLRAQARGAASAASNTD